MNWKDFIHCEEEHLFRGVVFRFPAKHPFENVVDFMIIEDFTAPLGLKLICSTGYHAGQTERVLPEEARHENGGISVKWLKSNWKKWVYSECDLEAVSYLNEYPSNF